MVSWGFAFKKGVIIFLWCIVWAIVGGVISGISSGAAMMGIWGAIAGIDWTSATAMQEFMEAFMGAIGVFMAGYVTGMIITSIGVFATLVKKIVETVQGLK